jgi:hypothetical protein
MAGRSILSIVLGNSKSKIELTKEKFIELKKNIDTTYNYSKTDTTVTTKDGDELDAADNIGSEETGYEKVDNGEYETRRSTIGLDVITKRIEDLYSDNEELKNDLTNPNQNIFKT